MRAFRRPLHLLLLHHALADHLVDRGLHEARADPFAIAIALAVVDDEARVVRDVGGELADIREHARRGLIIRLGLRIPIVVTAPALQVLIQIL
jgi:hypothetical protein